MSCSRPIPGWRGPGGKITMELKAGFKDRPVTVACGQCLACRIERTRQWGMRCMHEAQMHGETMFLTITYNNDNIPETWSINKEDLQKFWKKLRKKISPKKIKYFACGEYGDEELRPHYHACVFGLDMEDKTLHTMSGGNRLYTSEILNKIWGKGYILIGNVTFDSAQYIAKYIIKKHNGNKEETIKKYEREDKETGEIWAVEREWGAMSLKPAIGKEWYEKYKSDIYPKDYMYVNGKKMQPPKYYDKLHGEEKKEIMEKIKEKRVKKSIGKRKDNTWERLRAKNTVLEAKTTLYKGKI